MLACGLVTLGLLTGCETKSFIDPGEMGRYDHTKLTLPILNKVDPGIEEPNDQFVYATEPTPEDLQPTAGDYTIEQNDLLTIEIPELQAPGRDDDQHMRVTESGNITLPLIGQIHAEGRPRPSLKQAINEEYRRRPPSTKPQVTPSRRPRPAAGRSTSRAAGARAEPVRHLRSRISSSSCVTWWGTRFTRC